MIVGKSGAGKSTLGNALLNAELGPEDEYVPYFEERGGTKGCSQEITSRTSVDGNMRVIDTPGIPDPDRHNTAKYFNTIVKKIREVGAVNLLIFLVKEDRTDEPQFKDYCTLLKQINYIPWNKMMVCRQSDFAHRPNQEAVLKKRKEGLNFVADIQRLSSMDMPFKLHLDGISPRALKCVEEIAACARTSARIPLGDCPSLQTVEERRTFVSRLVSMKDRASALKEELTRAANAVVYHQRWRAGYTGVLVASSAVLLETEGISILPALAARGMIYITDRQIKTITAKKEKAKKELDTKKVDEDLFAEAKEEYEDLNKFCQAGSSPEASVQEPEASGQEPSTT